MTESASKSRVTLSLTVGLLTVVALAACATSSAGGGAMAATAADTAAIAQSAKSYEDAYNKKDVAGVVALYEADATHLLSNGKLVKGTADLTSTFTADTSHWAHLVIAPAQQTMISGDMATVIGTTETHVPGPGGQTMDHSGRVRSHAAQERRRVEAVHRGGNAGFSDARRHGRSRGEGADEGRKGEVTRLNQVSHAKAARRIVRRTAFSCSEIESLTA